MQILPGLYQAGGSLNGLTVAGGFLSPDYRDCNTYVLKTAEGLILMDCGNGDTLPQIFDNLQLWGLNPADIKACLLTHAHLDHAGGAHRLSAMGVALYAHKETADAIGSGDERCAGYLYHRHFHPCKVSHPLQDGDTPVVLGMQFEALHLPGHTRGCTAFRFRWQERNIVLSGDVIGTLLGGFFGWDGSIDFDKRVYLDSLRRLARVDMDLMLPGHGLVYFHQPRERVEEVFNEALMQWR